jgi:hypothetical protein
MILRDDIRHNRYGDFKDFIVMIVVVVLFQYRIIKDACYSTNDYICYAIVFYR